MQQILHWQHTTNLQIKNGWTLPGCDLKGKTWHKFWFFCLPFCSTFWQKPNPTSIRNLIDFKILWKGNGFSLSKTFGSSSCKLCMKERTSIMDRSWFKPNSLINRCSEIYGSCRHKPCFHRFSSSTDDASKAERDLSCVTKTDDDQENLHEKLDLELQWLIFGILVLRKVKNNQKHGESSIT